MEREETGNEASGSGQTLGSRAERAAAMARLIHLAGNLKRTHRTGWLDRGVPEGETESVADHAFRVALMAWALSHDDEFVGDVDPAHVLLIALAHDLPEALSGDPTPYAPDDVPRDPDERASFLNRLQSRSPEREAAKREREAAALENLLSDVDPRVADPLRSAWREYEARQTPAARLVRQADRLEAWLQSREYQAEHPDLPLESFGRQIAQPEVVPSVSVRALRDALARRFAAPDQPDGPAGGR